MVCDLTSDFCAMLCESCVHYIVQFYSGISRDRVLNEELYVPRFQKLIHLHFKYCTLIVTLATFSLLVIPCSH